MSSSNTLRIMAFGLLIAVAINIPFYSWVFNKRWDWVTGFPLGWLGLGLVYMSTFFHEIGHTLFAWFYGYPTLPSFDFQHGGGMAWSFGGQKLLIQLGVLAGLGYGIYFFKDRRFLQIMMVVLILLNVATAFTPFHRNVIDFMGPALVPLIAAFFLFRALMNLAPRGAFERLLNAVFGFGMIFMVFIDFYGLSSSKAYRLVYYQQKGQHGFGDFDKIAQRISFLRFEDVVYFWIFIALFSLILPFILFVMSKAENFRGAQNIAPK